MSNAVLFPSSDRFGANMPLGPDDSPETSRPVGRSGNPEGDRSTLDPASGPGPFWPKK